MASQAHIIQHVLSLFNGEPNTFQDNRFKKGFLLKLNVFESKSRLNLSKYRRHQVFGLRFHTMGDLWLGSVGITNLSSVYSPTTSPGWMCIYIFIGLFPRNPHSSGELPDHQYWSTGRLANQTCTCLQRMLGDLLFLQYFFFHVIGDMMKLIKE